MQLEFDFSIPEDTEKIICFEWHFFIKVTTKKGKKYKNHQEFVLGTDYGNAKTNLEIELKRKRWTLDGVNAVKITRVAFAYYKIERYPSVPSEKYKDLLRPTIPENL